jgi:hypothetical protein
MRPDLPCATVDYAMASVARDYCRQVGRFLPHACIPAAADMCENAGFAATITDGHEANSAGLIAGELAEVHAWPLPARAFRLRHTSTFAAAVSISARRAV